MKKNSLFWAVKIQFLICDHWPCAMNWYYVVRKWLGYMPSSSTFRSFRRMASCFFLHLDFCWGTAARACASTVWFDDEKIILSLSIPLLFKLDRVVSGETAFWNVLFWCALKKRHLLSSVRFIFGSWNLTFLTPTFLESFSNDNQDDGIAVTVVCLSFI